MGLPSIQVAAMECNIGSRKSVVVLDNSFPMEYPLLELISPDDWIDIRLCFITSFVNQ